MALRLKAELERRGTLRYIINTEPHGDHWTGNAFFDVPVIAHEGVRDRILSTNFTEHVSRVGQMGPDEPKLLEGYQPNAPVITFKERDGPPRGEPHLPAGPHARPHALPGRHRGARRGRRLHQRQHLLQVPDLAAGGRPR